MRWVYFIHCFNAVILRDKTIEDNSSTTTSNYDLQNYPLFRLNRAARKKMKQPKTITGTI